MRTDFENLPEGQVVILHPGEANFMHREPVRAERQGHYLFCDGSDHPDDADYTMADVSAYCRGWELAGGGDA